MKKMFALFFGALLLCFAVGCGANQGAETREATAPTETDSATQDETADETPDIPENDSADSLTESVSETATPEPDVESRVLVAYFSATGTTRGVAENLAAALNADLYEITPAEPYSAEDLNYNDRTTCATVEQNTPDVRPAIAGGVDNMEQYDTVFIGYPIWWGDAPRIVSTFAESYDFAGKTLIPFCTSGGSGISTSERTLRGQADDGEWLSGKRFNGNASAEELGDWAASLGVTP